MRRSLISGHMEDNPVTHLSAISRWPYGQGLRVSGGGWRLGEGHVQRVRMGARLRGDRWFINVRFRRPFADEGVASVQVRHPGLPLSRE